MTFDVLAGSVLPVPSQLPLTVDRAVGVHLRHDRHVVVAAAIFQMSGSDNHVAIVTQANTDGTIETVSGDWQVTGSTEPGFASTSKVVLNAPAYPEHHRVDPRRHGTDPLHVRPAAGAGEVATQPTNVRRVGDLARLETRSNTWFVRPNYGKLTMVTASTPRLLVIDDDEALCGALRMLFTSQGFAVTAEHGGLPGLERAKANRPDVVLLDLDMPDLGGLEVLPRLLEINPGTPVVMLTGNHEVRPAVQAVQLGAFDYLTKPFDNQDIVMVVRRGLERAALRTEVETLRRRVEEETGLASQMGPSAEVQAIPSTTCVPWRPRAFPS